MTSRKRLHQRTLVARVESGLAEERASEQPARALDADDAAGLEALLAVRQLDRHADVELGTERPVDLLARATQPGDLEDQVVAHLVPQSTGAGRGERPQLERGVLGDQDRRGDLAVLALGRQLDRERVLRAYEQGSEVDVGRVAVGRLLR